MIRKTSGRILSLRSLMISVILVEDLYGATKWDILMM